MSEKQWGNGSDKGLRPIAFGENKVADNLLAGSSSVKGRSGRWGAEYWGTGLTKEPVPQYPLGEIVKGAWCPSETGQPQSCAAS